MAGYSSSQSWKNARNVVRSTGAEFVGEFKSRGIRPNMRIVNLFPRGAGELPIIRAWGTIDSRINKPGREVGGSRPAPGVWHDYATTNTVEEPGFMSPGTDLISGVALTTRGHILSWNREDEEYKQSYVDPQSPKRGRYDFVELPLWPNASSVLPRGVINRGPWRANWSGEQWQNWAAEIGGAILHAAETNHGSFHI